MSWGGYIPGSLSKDALLPIGSRVVDLDYRSGTVTGISKDGGKHRWVKWDDGESYACPVEELRLWENDEISG